MSADTELRTFVKEKVVPLIKSLQAKIDAMEARGASPQGGGSGGGGGGGGKGEVDWDAWESVNVPIDMFPRDALWEPCNIGKFKDAGETWYSIASNRRKSGTFKFMVHKSVQDEGLDARNWTFKGRPSEFNQKAAWALKHWEALKDQPAPQAPQAPQGGLSVPGGTGGFDDDGIPFRNEGLPPDRYGRHGRF